MMILFQSIKKTYMLKIEGDKLIDVLSKKVI